jgi:hypothetical protein
MARVSQHPVVEPVMDSCRLEVDDVGAVQAVEGVGLEATVTV